MAELHFTQASLEDYQQCARRFQLRYLQAQAWPAEVTEPADVFERHMRQGAALHRLIQQDLLGMPRARLSALAGEEPLAAWWQSYVANRPSDLPPNRYPEIELSAELEGYRLLGKFDLLAFSPGERYVIVDWKTERKPPGRERLAGRMQTILYPFLLVEGGQDFNGGAPIEPSRVEMLYWFTADPLQPQRFTYDPSTHQANRQLLAGLLSEIARRRAQDDFPLTPDERRCRFCVYRSLCKRGKAAGEFEALDSADEAYDPYFELDFDSLDEVPF